MPKGKVKIARTGRIGDPAPARRYVLDVAEFVPPGPIDAASYYKTSGDAVVKCRVLIRDLRARGTPGQLEGAERMLAALIAARGEKVHLETERGESHELICTAKNPRSTGPKRPKIATF